MTNQCTVSDCGKRHYAFGLCAAHYTRQRRHGHATAGGTTKGEPMEWLVSHVSHADDDCLIWPYAKARGYGIVSTSGKQRVAANLMCELVNGPAPSPKHETAHSCGRGQFGCVNPRHVRWATRTENRHDMLVHGVRPRGSRSGGSKLTDDSVRQIRKLKAEGVHADTLAAQFGVSRATVYLVVKGDRWGWLT